MVSTILTIIVKSKRSEMTAYFVHNSVTISHRYNGEKRLQSGYIRRRQTAQFQQSNFVHFANRQIACNVV